MDKNSLKEIIEECSNKNVKVVNTGGTSALGLLGVVLIALKLTGYINISWLWVLSPFWIPFAIVIMLVLLIFSVVFIFSFSKDDNTEDTIVEKENTTVVNNGIIITPNADVKNTTKSSKKKSSKKNVNNESGNAKNTDKRI